MFVLVSSDAVNFWGLSFVFDFSFRNVEPVSYPNLPYITTYFRALFAEMLSTFWFFFFFRFSWLGTVNAELFDFCVVVDSMTADKSLGPCIIAFH